MRMRGPILRGVVGRRLGFWGGRFVADGDARGVGKMNFIAEWLITVHTVLF
jgi:hypothetical protein